MTEDTALAIRSTEALTPQDIIGQVALIQQVMAGVMHDGEHFGRIPGCGDKPSLLKPGAEKLAMTFRLAPEYDIKVEDLGAEHRDYLVVCSLRSLTSREFVGQGVGSCSTKEAKYRFRTGAVEFTGEPVPSEYWDTRKDDPAGALELLGGRGHSTKKNPDTGAWEIVVAGEKVEHDNPADTYNTVLKMAQKRAFIAAILSATAASDIFTQDLEDLAPVRASQPIPVTVLAADETLWQIEEGWKALGRTDASLHAALLQRFGTRKLRELTPEQAEQVLAGIRDTAARP